MNDLIRGCAIKFQLEYDINGIRKSNDALFRVSAGVSVDSNLSIGN